MRKRKILDLSEYIWAVTPNKGGKQMRLRPDVKVPRGFGAVQQRYKKDVHEPKAGDLIVRFVPQKKSS